MLKINNHHAKYFPMLGSFWALFGFFVAGGFAGMLKILINQSNNMHIFEYVFLYRDCWVVVVQISYFYEGG